MTTERIPIPEGAVDGWLDAAKGSDPHEQLFDEMDAVMEQLRQESPWRVRRLRKNLRWLRIEAGKRGIEWGAL